MTRPAHQAQNLCSKINLLGWKAIQFPTIEIEPGANPKLLKNAVEQLSSFDVAIFMSPNAVLQLAPLLQEIKQSGVKIAAVGQGTAQHLLDHHLAVDYCPQQNYSSEDLLALPVFQRVAGKKMMLFRGAGGRELFGKTLQQRGAKITEVIAYRRKLPKIASVLPFAINEIDIIVCTSTAGLQNLVEMCGGVDRAWLQNMSLLVISQRMIPVAEALGFAKQPVLAENATDAAIIKALVIWQERVNGDCAIKSRK